MSINTNISAARIPGPRGHFLLGSIPDIQRDRVQFLVDLQRDFGDVVKIRLGPAEGVVIYHPDAIQRVLVDNHKNYSKDTPTYSNLRLLIGNGMLSSSGDLWVRQRRLMQPAFHRNEINALSEMIVEETITMLDRLEEPARSGKPVRISHDLMNLTMGVVSKALLGKRVQDEDGDLGETIGFLMSDTAFRFEHPFYPPLWFPASRNRLFNTAKKRIDKVIFGVISERRKHMGEANNLLDMIMQASLEENAVPQGESRSMNDVQLRDEVLTLFLAGHETTAVCLYWTLYLLIQHPEIEARLRKEIDDVLGGRPPRLEDLPRLEYARMVRDESMRLYSPAWLTERKALGDDVLCGYTIPAGTILAITPFVTHRHPAFWDHPAEFDPDRFSAARSQGRHDFAFFPFGGGPRMCIGRNLALLETHMMLVMLLQRYRFEMEPGWPVQFDAQLSLRIKDAMVMRLKPV